MEQKYLFWGYSKWWLIKQSTLGFNRGRSSNFFVPGKYKPCDIYRRMYIVYREACFIKTKTKRKCLQMN